MPFEDLHGFRRRVQSERALRSQRVAVDKRFAPARLRRELDDAFDRNAARRETAADPGDTRERRP